MEMHQISYFLAVCETLNFTRAAERCHVSQPALSLAIKKLEDEVGGPLLSRERNAVRLTPLGEALQPRLQQIQQQTQAAASDAWRLVNFNQQPLRIGMLVTVGPTRLAQFLAEFQRQHPGLFVEISDGRQEGLLAQLRNRELDVAVLNPFEPLGDEFAVQPLYRERYLVCFRPGHRFENQAQIEMAEMSGEPYVDRLACEMREMALAVLGKRNIELNARFRSDREDWVQGMVISGCAVAVLPEFAILVSGIQTRPLVEPQVNREVAAVSLAAGEPPAPVAAFHAALADWDWGEIPAAESTNFRPGLSFRDDARPPAR